LEACYISKHKNLDPSSRRSRPVDEVSSGSSRTTEHSVKRQRSDRVAGKENRGGNSPSAEQSSVKDNSYAMFRKPAPQPIVLLSTSLDPHLQSKLAEFAERCTGVTVTNNFYDAVTHVVVETDKRRVLKQRTMKYLQAIISTSPTVCHSSTLAYNNDLISCSCAFSHVNPQRASGWCPYSGCWTASSNGLCSRKRATKSPTTPRRACPMHPGGRGWTYSARYCNTHSAL
jgi:hypothetical protein